MTSLTIQTERPNDSEPILDGLSRRGLVALCLLLLAMGMSDALRFLIYDLSPLLETARLAPDAPDGVAQANAMRGWARLGGYVAALLTVVYFLVIQRTRLKTHKQVVDNVSLMLVLIGVILLASRLVLQKVDSTMNAWGIVDITLLHLAACMTIPWSWKDSVVPFIPLLLIWALVMLVPDAGSWDIFDRVVVVIMSGFVLAPGALIASWRKKRWGEDIERLQLGEQVRNIGGELTRARIVHDAMFPGDYDDGHICFEYEYDPIHEIGGDYVHLHVCPITGKVFLTLLDVAGHGLAAALTVNRLFGELERIRAENPDAEPADVMALLNRYIYLTMARHGMFATGACFMLDPNTGILTWVNAGHPPTLLRRSDGRVFDLKGTTMLLGAQSDEEFDTNQQAIKIAPGDVVIAYTDGAYEARNPDGKSFGLSRMREIVRFKPAPRSWTRFIANAVQKHHAGQAEDDVLIVALTLKSLRVGQPAERARAAEGNHRLPDIQPAPTGQVPLTE